MPLDFLNSARPSKFSGGQSGSPAIQVNRLEFYRYWRASYSVQGTIDVEGQLDVGTGSSRARECRKLYLMKF